MLQIPCRAGTRGQAPTRQLGGNRLSWKGNSDLAQRRTLAPAGLGERHTSH
uniref:Uncharacterized protein n=1 Tax=Amphimedon queenslandica TaxID=400682 RepID=A0A1X7T8X0_AMPQE